MVFSVVCVLLDLGTQKWELTLLTSISLPGGCDRLDNTVRLLGVVFSSFWHREHL